MINYYADLITVSETYLVFQRFYVDTFPIFPRILSVGYSFVSINLT